MKKVIYILLSLALLSTIVALAYLWNKPIRNIEKTATQAITAINLTQSFDFDEPLATKIYLNKPLAVSGIVKEISTNAQGNQVVFLEGYTDTAVVQCTLEKVYPGVHPGDEITINGFCNGFTLAVILDNCQIKK